METAIENVQNSYVRCCQDKEFIKKFYRRFLKQSNEIWVMFEYTNWNRQRELLKTALKSVILYAANPESEKVRGHMLALGKSHSSEGLNVKPIFYPMWAESMIHTIKERDPEYTDELGKEWLSILTPAIELMISKYKKI